MPEFIRSILQICFVFACMTPLHAGELDVHPLQPLDCSSPRATMKSYIVSVNAISEYLQGEHWNEPSKETVDQISTQTLALMRLIDTSGFPPAIRHKMSVEAALHLAEVIRRIDPDILLSAPGSGSSQPLPDYWTVPNTEIGIIRIEDGERAGDYVFSSETAERAVEYYELIKDHPVYGESDSWLSKREYLTPAGWMLSSRFIESFPDWLKRSYLGQGLWKLIVLAVFIMLWMALLFLVIRGLGSTPDDSDIARHLRNLGLPIVMLFISWNVHQVLFQITFAGMFATGLAFTSAVLLYVGLALLSMPLAMLFVELIIRSPHISSDCLNAHLLRIGGRTAGLGIAITFLFLLSEQIGFPLYGLIAGVGVGGLAVALAARQSLENYLAGINLLSDQPVSIGDWCKYQENGSVTFGEVLSIGMRSTRIRNFDNTVTSIPNGNFANMMITNLSARNGMYVFRKTLRLRMDTTETRIDEVLEAMRTYLGGHDCVTESSGQAHLEDIGPDAINLRIRCQIDTSDACNQWVRFLDLQEEILGRLIAIVQDGGVEFAYPTTIIKNIGDMNRS